GHEIPGRSGDLSLRCGREAIEPATALHVRPRPSFHAPSLYVVPLELRLGLGGGGDGGSRRRRCLPVNCGRKGGEKGDCKQEDSAHGESRNHAGPKWSLQAAKAKARPLQAAPAGGRQLTFLTTALMAFPTVS